MNERKEALPDYLFHEGTNYRSYLYFGSHFLPSSESVPAGAAGKASVLPGAVAKDKASVVFRVWAPAAASVEVVGDFCDWEIGSGVKLHRRPDDPSVWEGISEGWQEYDLYKYCITDAAGKQTLKCDPYGFHMETRPATGTKVYRLEGYEWQDGAWMEQRREKDVYSQPINIYELHLGSWRRRDGEVYSYDELGKDVAAYVKDMGYTHVEIMPLGEHPLDDSWGYQVMGYFAPTSRYGTPKDLMRMVDILHQNGIGVILDWVPAHFPKDEPGLSLFDGTPLYEYADPRKGEHYGWGTKVFNFGRKEVVSFLTSSAMYWLDQYHIDGLRVDAVASMLYLSYCRPDGEWIPNSEGGAENWEAAAFLQSLNTAVHREYPGVMTVAEESTVWDGVTAPVEEGGLGFTFKWNMGWMNDTLRYMQTDPIYRQYAHENITFSLTYAFAEHFVLPLSHDEVVHGKHSLLDKNPGSYEQKFAGLRAFYGYMMAHPGKKLLFMGSEFGQFIEWDYKKQLDWFLLSYPIHNGLKSYVWELNHFYLTHPALYEQDDSWDGFQWINPDDRLRNIASFRRMDRDGNEVVCVLNFAPVRRDGYRIGVKTAGEYREVLNSDEQRFGGNGDGNPEPIQTEEIPCCGYERSLAITVPALSCVYFELKNSCKNNEKPLFSDKNIVQNSGMTILKN